MQQNVEPRTVDLTDAIPRILKLMRPVVGEDIEVVWKPDTGLHQILVDPAQLDQIMANLVMNSRHAIEIAGRITITAKNAPAGQHIRNEIPAPTCDSVALVVEDNGVGMTPEVQSRMFDPFFTTRDPGKGTGLGLSTVYGIIQQNQGSIHVQTEPGRGTTITMVFRAAEPTVDDDSEDGWASREKLEGTETILLAEDQSELLTILQSSLAQRGYRVLAAHTAAEVLRLVEDTKEPIHLLVTDVIMPGMNGRELANTVLEKRPGLPVLYMSGYARDVITGRKLLPQETEVLQKPFSPRMLHRRIREILDAQCPT
jgi:CheY-like chemotaxis protein